MTTRQDLLPRYQESNTTMKVLLENINMKYVVLID